MRPLDEYKTWRKIEADLKKEGLIKVDEYLFGENTGYSDWITWLVGWESEENRFSCAILEWGNFRTGSSYDYLYPWIIKRAILKFKPKFVRCSTTEEMSTELNTGLLDNGFILTGRIKSNHGRYMVYLWEYQKKTPMKGVARP